MIGVTALVVFLALGGVGAYLAGIAGLNGIRHLEEVGEPAEALVRYRAPGPDDTAPPPHPLLQFTTRTAEVVEVFSPVASSRAHPLRPGALVRLRYDPADPRQVLLEGRQRRGVERVFVLLGVTALLTAVVLLVVSP
ncbi:MULTISPECIES: DUF3592 domain-containing protein [Kitasatospora]|jgi:hypothetical protein|uniref:DUF3592 domain-containing protein n=1 Tax=Kitasatospora TaxID=2063 RepID=UPI000C70EE75|nr:DUF3592 domain-containing protein [Kitasatospora sp. GP30]MDH6141961.1 hypothetical protein [Kitasatospora sp. GP30]